MFAYISFREVGRRGGEGSFVLHPRSPNPSPEMGSPHWLSGKASTSIAEDPGFESCLRRDFFGVKSYQ